jgi:hypothetical protein
MYVLPVEFFMYNTKRKALGSAISNRNVQRPLEGVRSIIDAAGGADVLIPIMP